MNLAIRMHAAVVVSIAFMMMVPAFVHAQAAPQDELHAAIWTSLLSDPRSANIPPAQMKVLVDSLAEQAVTQNLNAADILWRPEVAQPYVAAANVVVDQCESGVEGYICALNAFFGFSGSSYVIPVALLLLMVFLIAATWELILHHRKKLNIIAPGAMPWDNMPK